MSAAEPPTFFDADPFPAEQFEDAGQQRGAATLAMWAFIAQEVLFLGAVIVSFYVYRTRWHDDFAAMSRELSWKLGTVNTAVLLVSSFTMALAVAAATEGRRTKTFRLLIVTVLLGLLFLAFKGVEYGIDYRDHLVPSINYSPAAPGGAARPDRGELFMTFYFVATGLHALHVAIGIVLLAVIARRARRGRYGAGRHTAVEVCGLYWHFVDLVWVFLFPTLYLLRHA